MCQGPPAPDAVVAEGPELKKCGACGEMKGPAEYSKAQYKAKSTRRCKACVAADLPAISRAPPPLAKTLSWELYYLLRGVKKDAVGSAEKKANYLRAAEGLTEGELNEWRFADHEEACMAVLRATALLDTPGGNDCRPASFLLIARAMLWLARDAQRCRPLPAGDYAPLVNLGHEAVSLQRCLQCYAEVLKRQQHVAPLALALYGFANVRCVACHEGHSARPSWGEAWLVRGELEILLGELHAHSYASKASGKRPPGRRGPWDDAKRQSFFEDDDLLDTSASWEVDVPGHPQLEKKATTHLADAWWGMAPHEAEVALAKYLAPALNSAMLAEANADKKQMVEIADRLRALEDGARCRGAAALWAVDAATDPANSKAVARVDGFRKFFPGAPFEPSAFFVEGLPQDEDAGSLWALGSVTDATSAVVDAGAGFYRGATLCTVPSPKDAAEAYDVLLRAMAGAGDEPRAKAGPPRRPKVVEVDASLAEGLTPLLAKLDVGVVAADKPRGCFKLLKRGARGPRFAAGDVVRVEGLVAKKQHNGRVGDVVQWLADKDRFAVMLKPEGGKAETLLSLKAQNLMIVG
mmetsp:Transcript_26286/g.78827  ORF Transcript_26286/g.78827 Transcript_26286/m.78827 type:complete len:580 (+) Transcript_26286:275-2014(+)